MEKFMLIFHRNQIEVNRLTRQQIQTRKEKWMAWLEKIKKTGEYVTGEPLLPGGKLVSGPGGKTVTDGPYTEGKEVIGSFFIINAKDMNEAVTISKQYPDYEMGGAVQVRQVMKIEMQ